MLPYFSRTLGRKVFMSAKQPSPEKPCALFWDESFLWGLMAWRALREAGLPFDLVRSEDLLAGNLSRYAMILVPGGWASAKLQALGNKGQTEIRRFVESGGSYLGICGGAGLATENHLGLLPVCRKSNSERVPSFSGPILLTTTEHPIWKNVQTPVFHAWWPPQLYTACEIDFSILARYDEAQKDAMSADVRVEEGWIKGWPELEKRYGILLDPKRLKGEPAVVEGICGRGKVILSLVHFDTPGDSNGALVLRNLWHYLIKDTYDDLRFGNLSGGRRVHGNDSPFMAVLEDIKAAVDHLIAVGERNLLWRRRNSLLLQWRRGVRGMEYSTLSAMTAEIMACLSGNQASDAPRDKFAPPLDPAQLTSDLDFIRILLIPFVDEAAELLQLERLWLTASVTPGDYPEEKINHLRQNLFGSSRSFGGKFKNLIDAMDHLLFNLLKTS